MNRRDLLKLITAATGMSLIGENLAFAEGAKSSSVTSASLFTQEDIGKFDEIAETIIPRTDTPGAKDAAVGAFMAVFVADCYTAKQREIFMTALPDIEKRSKEGHGKEFMKLDAAEKHALLSALDKEAKATSKPDNPHYFTMVKQLVLMGFFTSKTGATEVLVYDEIPGSYESCVPYKKGQPAWGTT